jgi:polyisoprenoid-binding protein YceI
VTFRSLLAAALLALTGCTSELDNKTAATVADAPTAKPAPAKPTATPATTPPPGPDAAASPAGAFLKLGAESEVSWVGAKVTKDHAGGFKVLSGEATVAKGALTSATVVMDLTSIFTDSEKLTGHLKKADFFDVGTFPTATYSITAIKPNEGGKPTVVGTLDLHGVQKEVTFPADVTVNMTQVTIAAEFTLNRQDFGLTYPGKPDDLIRDEVLIKGKLVFAP